MATTTIASPYEQAKQNTSKAWKHYITGPDSQLEENLRLYRVELAVLRREIRALKAS